MSARRLSRCTQTELNALVAHYPRRLIVVDHDRRYLDPWIGTIALGGPRPLIWRWPPGMPVRMTREYRAQQGRAFGELPAEVGRVDGETELGLVLVVWESDTIGERHGHPPDGLEVAT
jgi:hypothetical protein